MLSSILQTAVDCLELSWIDIHQEEFVVNSQNQLGVADPPYFTVCHQLLSMWQGHEMLKNAFLSFINMVKMSKMFDHAGRFLMYELFHFIVVNDFNTNFVMILTYQRNDHRVLWFYLVQYRLSKHRLLRFMLFRNVRAWFITGSLSISIF